MANNNVDAESFRVNRPGVTNVVFAGLGGQGVIKASDILAEAAFRAGHDVKKSEVHGMSQRGGSVTSDVRFGDTVLSPMVPEGEADYLVVLESSQTDAARHFLREGGVLITPDLLLEQGQTLDSLDKDESSPIKRRTLNTALLGVLSTFLTIGETDWRDALRNNLPEKTHTLNEEVFALSQHIAHAR